MAENIYQAILEVRKNVGVVNKNGKNTFHKYNYATANDVIHEVRDEMNAQGIVIIPKDVTDLSTTKDGNVQHFTQHYTLAHADSNSTVQAAVRCAGEDKGDKSPYKGNTGALKYLLIQTFLLPTEDDPENDSKDKKQKQTKSAPKPKTPQISDTKPQISDSNPAGIPEHCPDRKSQISAIGKMIVWMASGDKEKASDLLKKYSEYKGISYISMVGLGNEATSERVKVIYGKVKAKYLEEVELQRMGA